MVGIGFFAPLPLAMMMPFMAGQSMIMGDAFGKSYQYGKRKISAMSNEEFNKLTPTDLATQLQTDYLSMIPSLKASVKASTDFQSFIIRELAEIIKNLPPDIYKAITDNNPLTAEASSGEATQLFGTADATTGHNTQKNNQGTETDWLKVLTSLAGVLLGTGRGVITPNRNIVETEEERIAADKLALNIIEGDNTNSTQQERINARNKYAGDTLRTLQDKLRLSTNTPVEIAEINKRISELTPKINIPIPTQIGLTSQESAQKAYLTQTINLQQEILTTKGAVITAQNEVSRINNLNHPTAAQRNLAAQLLSAAQKTFNTKTRALQNFVLLSRNNLTLKSVANRDWNDRIWNM